MRKGFTTGSCAAAASKAALFMLLSRTPKEEISIMTPAGILYTPRVTAIEIGEDFAECGIIKDGGDDPDSTTGALICSRVELCEGAGIKILGGKGVGLVTRPGLEMPVGQYAINSVPRKMIKEELEEVMALFEYTGGVTATIFVPEGEIIAKKTFNPHMGIEGGISILGTSGIVEPMSSEALIKTIKLDLAMKKAEGNETAILVPGNYGETFLKNDYNIDPERVVHFSNYMGIALDLAKECGFKRVLVVGHTGKLAKVAGGIMNTHSREADCRLEIMTSAFIRAAIKNNYDFDNTILERLLNAATTTAALDIISETGLVGPVSNELLDKILFYLRKRAGDEITVECILYENSYGLLAKSENAEEFL